MDIHLIIIQKQSLIESGFNTIQAEHFKKSSQHKIRCLKSFKEYGSICDCDKISQSDIDYIKESD